MNANNPTATRPVWKQFGDDAAQLFRDFYFEKYPITTSAATVFGDLSRPYRFYNKTSFYKHLKTTINRVKTFKEFGTGVDNELFLRKLRLDQVPSSEERGRGSTGLANNQLLDGRDDNYDSDSDDETFKTRDGYEEDVPLPDTFELESFLGNLSIHEDQEVVEDGAFKSIKRERRKKMNIGSDNNGDFNNDLGVKYLVQLPDGRLCAIVYLPSGFQGYFMVSEDGKKVIMKTKIPKVMISAERCFQKLGLGKQDAFVVHMQSKMNDLIDNYGKKTDDFGDTSKIVNEKVIFKLPFEVKRTFFNERGDEDHQCQIGEYSGVEWSYFFMVNANVQKLASPEPKMSRDRSRPRRLSNNNNNNGSSSNRAVTISNQTNTIVDQRSIRRRIDEEQFYSPRNMDTTNDNSQYTYEDVSDDDASL
jgi:hypothetical protein